MNVVKISYNVEHCVYNKIFFIATIDMYWNMNIYYFAIKIWRF